MISNVKPGCAFEDLPRVAFRLGRAIQFPNGFEFAVGWDKAPFEEPGVVTYRRTAGVVVTFPIIRGRFSIRPFR